MSKGTRSFLGAATSRMWSAAAITAVLVLSACGGSSQTASSTGSLSCKNGHLLIGIDKAATGGAAFFDIHGEHGLQVAIDEVNAAGGIHGCQISTISGDSKSDPAVGGQVAQDMIQKGVQILVVADDFDQGIAAAQAGERAGLLVLSAGASSTQFARAVGPHMFSGGIPTNVLGSSVAKFAISKGWKNVFMVVNKSLAYFTEQEDAYKAVAGTNVVGEDINNSFTAADFSSTISKIQATNPKPDVIYDILTFPPVGTFVKQLRAAGITTPVVGDGTMDTRDFPQLIGTAGVQNVYYCTQMYWVGAGVDPATDPGMVKFIQEYQAKYNQFPEQSNAPTAWLFFTLIARALNQPGVIDPDSAAKAINAQMNIQLPGALLHRWTNDYAVWDGNIIGFTPAGGFTYITKYPAE